MTRPNEIRFHLSKKSVRDEDRTTSRNYPQKQTNENTDDLIYEMKCNRR